VDAAFAEISKEVCLIKVTELSTCSDVFARGGVKWRVESVDVSIICVQIVEGLQFPHSVERGCFGGQHLFDSD
jgi:hypothetical protein